MIMIYAGWKQDYVNAAMLLPIDWLANCAVNPSPYMRPIHVALIRIALRRKID